VNLKPAILFPQKAAEKLRHSAQFTPGAVEPLNASGELLQARP
jgi:hypothetical protein